MMTVAERKDFVLDLIRILPCRLCSSSGKIPAGFSRMSRNNLRSLWLVWIAVAASKIRPLHCWLCMSAHRNNSLAFACLVIWWHRDTRTVAPEEVDVNRALESNYGKCFCNIARRKCCSRFSSSLHASGKRRRICPSVEPPTMPVSQIVPKENIPPAIDPSHLAANRDHQSLSVPFDPWIHRLKLAPMPQIRHTI